MPPSQRFLVDYFFLLLGSHHNLFWWSITYPRKKLWLPMLLHWYPVLGFLSIHATTEIFQKIFHGIPGYSYGFLIWCQPLPMTFIWSCCICSFPSNSHAIPMLLHYNCITSLCNICLFFNIICIVPIGCSWFTHIIPIVPPQEFLWLI